MASSESHKTYSDHCSAVVSAFMAALPAWFEEVGGSADVAALSDRIKRDLEEWADRTAHAQRQSPLAIVRSVVASIIEETGTERDLATSTDLGETAWKTHVAWGIARAEALSGLVPATRTAPASTGVDVAVVSSNLMDRTRIDEVLKSAGYQMLAWRNPAAVDEGLEVTIPIMAFVDLNHGAANTIIATLAAKDVPMIAFGPHVDEHALAAALSLGADQALPRSIFYRRLPTLLPKIV